MTSAVAQNGIFNNISQLWNHNQFWEMMGPTGREMPSELESAISKALDLLISSRQTFQPLVLDNLALDGVGLLKIRMVL